MKQIIAAATLIAVALRSATTDGFGTKLSKDKVSLHALSRLTWGPRPGDLAEIGKTGLKTWIDRQLNPEKIAENPVLEQRLGPLTSLNLNSRQVLEQYPSPQLIVAYATGRLPMPEEPERRAVVERLAVRYKDRIAKKDRSAALNLAQGDVAGIAQILNPGEVRILRNGSPEERNALLESLPPDTIEKLTYSLTPNARKGLFSQLPAEMRRKILLNVAPQQVLAHDLQEAKLYRAVYSNRQLQDLLTDFWFNHFNVYLDKGADRYLLTTYERDAIRPHVLGKFRDMLQATAEHPAMLFYLDNWQSVSSDMAMNRRGKLGNKRSRGLNENYARELLELHSLGVDTGYTQKDIVEVARCFTGWTIADPYRGPVFAFNERAHDKGEKTVLGVTIPAGGGKDDGQKVLDIISRNPSTAKFLSLKLAQRFVADNPPPALIDTMAKAFQKSGGDLRETMKVMLASREFWSESAYKSKVKTPLEMVASALRASGAEVTFAFGLANQIAGMGQPLYRKQEPTGYSSRNEEWMSSAALLGRMNFAVALAQNRLPGVKVEQKDLSPEALLFEKPSPQIQQAIAEKKEAAEIGGLVLGSPEFQRR